MILKSQLRYIIIVFTTYYVLLISCLLSHTCGLACATHLVYHGYNVARYLNDSRVLKTTKLNFIEDVLVNFVENV